MKQEQQTRRTPVKFYHICEDEAGQRLDNYLFARYKDLPKSLIYRIVRSGELRVNSRRVKVNYRLNTDDAVRVPPFSLTQLSDSDSENKERKARQLSLAATRVNIPVLYEDEVLLVVNKPSGLAVHGGSGLSYGLIELLREQRPEERYLELAHRLDRETSGCVLLAKNRQCLCSLHELLKSTQGIKKQYLALVSGAWPKKLNRVEQPLARDRIVSGEHLVRVSATGKESLTTFQVHQAFHNATLLQARPVTGRTHQIRVHAAHAGHPLLGDSKYSNKSTKSQANRLGLKRLFLHAHSLKFKHPSKPDLLSISAPLPEELSSVLDGLTA